MSLVARWPEICEAANFRVRKIADQRREHDLGPARTSSYRPQRTVNAAAAAQAGTGLKINVTYGNTVPAADADCLQ